VSRVLVAIQSSISEYQNGLIRKLELSTDERDARTSIFEFLRNVGISSVGYLEEAKEAKGFSITELQSIQHYQINLSQPGEGTYYIYVELTNQPANKMGLRHYPSLIATLIDGEISLLGSHPINSIKETPVGSANWGGFVTGKDTIKIDFFLQFGAKIRNLFLLWQTCA
jgi:hypothetical protein